LIAPHNAFHASASNNVASQHPITQKEHQMKRANRTQLKCIAAAMCVASASFANLAMAEDFDCFPMCQPTPQTATAVAAPAEEGTSTPDDVAKVGAEPVPTACQAKPGIATSAQDTINKAEALNDKVKPVKEIVGYIRSPQGLAIKLVNDHVVKIPAWVGYAMDPIGSVKSKAMDKARDYAKAQLKAAAKEENACAISAPTEHSNDLTTAPGSIALAELSQS
jgi:hypothetical protein